MNFKRSVRFVTIWMVIIGILFGWVVQPVRAQGIVPGPQPDAASPWSLSFSGSSNYVTFGKTLGTAEFTLETWFKRTGAGTTASTGTGGVNAVPLITKGVGEADANNRDANYFLGIRASDNVLAADFEDTTNGLNHPIVGVTTIANNVWYHAAVTYGGGKWQLFLNGKLEAELRVDKTPRFDSIQGAALGTTENSTGARSGYFAGVLDEARIWNVARTQAQILGTMNEEISAQTGLIGYWKMNEGSGTILTDSSASGINGTISGATWSANGFDITGDVSAPAAPGGPTAIPGDNLVSLSWPANSETDLIGYNLYRSITTPVLTSGTPVNGNNLIPSASYIDAGLVNGTPYYYAITAVDSSNNTSGASIEANATPVDALGYGLDFEGTNDHVTFGRARNLGVEIFTIETWFRRDAAGVTVDTGAVTAEPLVTKGRGEADSSNVDLNYFLGIRPTDNRLVADFEDGATGANHLIEGNTPIVNGTWYHAAVTYDGSNLKLYLNGASDATTITINKLLPRADSIQHAALGTAMNSTGVAAGYFNGVLDEVRIWNYARTETQIFDNQSAEIMVSPGLLARWGLNEGSGTQAKDSAGLQVLGSLTNGPVWTGNFPLPTPPSDPSGLSASSSTFFQVDLTWTDTSTNESSFEIERCIGIGCSTFSILTTRPSNSQAFADNSVQPLTDYCYRVRAVNGAGTSGYTNTACTTTPAEGASALEFNGTDQYVTFGEALPLGVTSFTLESWIKRSIGGKSMGTGTNGLGDGSLPQAYPILTKGRGQGESPANVNMNYWLGIATTGVIAADFEDTAGGANHPILGTTVVSDGTWHHIAVAYNGNCWSIYLDGNLETVSGSTTQCPNATPESNSIQHAALATALQSLGTLPADSGFFMGVIDEARIWNYARTQAEIVGTINDEVTSGTGLVGHWGMNEGVGTSAYNSVSGSPAGNLISAPTWVTPGAPFNLSAPAAPSSLSATAASAYQVNLAWTDSSNNETGFEIERCTGPSCSSFNLLTSLPAGSQTHSDTTVVPLTEYCYRAHAFNVIGASGYSNTSCVTTPDQPPSALDFGTSNAYVTFGEASPLKLAQFTLEGWFKREGAGTTANTGTGGFYGIPLITKGVGEAEGSNVDMNYFLGIRDPEYVICADFEEGVGGAGPLGQNHPVCGSTVIANDTWYHVAATYNGSTWNLYLNGVLEATLAVGQPVRSDSIQHAGLGVAMNSTGAASGHFDGVMDEVRIWNYARTMTEIRSTINSELNLPQTGMVARWGLNEGSGTVVNGSAGTAVNGAITGTGSSWVTPGAPFDVTFETIPPAAPTNLMASKRPGAVQLEWTANSEPDFSGYNVYRSTASPVVIGTRINSTLLVSPSYLDSDVTAGTPYFYAVTAVDTSGNESALSNETSAIPDPPPPPEALDFGSGTAYVTFGDPAALDLATFTIETWFKRTGAGTISTTGSSGITNALPLVTHGSPQDDGSNVDANWVLVIDDASDVIAADFEDNATGLNHPVVGTTPIVNNTWYHAAATYDGTTWRLYLNGNLEATLAVNFTPRADTTQHAGLATMIELDGTSLNGHFQGVLDEARVWNYARSQAEIVSAINAKLTTPQTGMVARWGLDEGTGTVVNDSSGNLITGTVTDTGYAWVAGSPFNAVVNLSPYVPVLVEPADNATGVAVPATLSVNVSDPESHALDVTFYGRPIQAAAGPDFTVIAIPDTQYYAATYPSIFNEQMNWVTREQVSENIVFVGSLGDNVDVASNLTQWTNAVTAWDIIDGAGLPYGLAAGNHDGAPASTVNFNTYFGETRFSGKPFYGGHQGSDIDNHYATFEASGMQFIVIFIEYDDGMTSTSHAVLQWANTVLQANSSRRAIVISHNLLQGGTSSSFTTQGQTIYNALKGNPNLFLMLGGHLDVASRRTDTFNGNTVYTLRSDYQSVDSQQSGYLRIMRFSPANNMIYVRTYSPTQLKDYDKSDAAQNNFSLPYTMGSAGFEVIGTATGVASGGTASVPWAGLDPNKEYEWFVVASDGTHQASSATWSFTTGTGNNAPTDIDLSNSSVAENSAANTPVGTLSTTDPDAGNTFTYSLTNGSGDTDNASFTISGNSLLTSLPFDYETKSSYSVRIRTTDQGSLSYEEAFTITVMNVNEAPVAVDDEYATTKNLDLVLTELQLKGNDTDVDNSNAQLSVTAVSNPVNGTVDLVSGSITFTPSTDFTGTAGFDYTVSDGLLGDSGHVTVIVSEGNSLPVITEGASVAVTMAKNGNPNVFTLTLHATDANAGDTLIWSIVVPGAAAGTASVVPPNTGASMAIGYTPIEDYVGADSFVVQVSDGNGGTDTITVNVSILNTHSIDLQAGWNLVSFNRQPTDNNIADVLASVTGSYDLVYSWDAATQTWKKYDPTADPFVNTLASLTEVMGFWIHMIAGDTLVVVGNNPDSSTDIPLKAGWNLVGYPAISGESLPGAITTHGGSTYIMVTAFQPTNGLDFLEAK